MTFHVPCLPPPSHAAFLLDFDGTLVDIAPSPDRVVVPPDLRENLDHLRARCGGALAIVTGRPIAQVDAYLGGADFAIAGEHGTAIRHSPGGAIMHRNLPDMPPGWVDAAKTLVARYPGTAFEPKKHGFVLHYRAAPEAGRALHTGLKALVADFQRSYSILGAKMAWEVRPAGVDKATAVRDLMSRPPFTGRLPIFVGDDVTDEDGMRESRALGGFGLRVPDIFADAADVRRWIKLLASPKRGGADEWPV